MAYNERDYTYGASTYAGTYAPKSRRSSIGSLRASRSGSGYRNAYFENSVDLSAKTSLIKFRARNSIRNGVSLQDAINGVKLGGNEYLRWYQIKADARGRIYVRITASDFLVALFKLDLIFPNIVDWLFCSYVRDSRRHGRGSRQAVFARPPCFASLPPLHTGE